MTSSLRVLFVLERLAATSETALIRLLGRHVDRRRVRIDVVACRREPDLALRATSDRVQRALEGANLDVDATPGEMSPDDRTGFLADRIAGYDIVVADPDLPELQAAFARIAWRPRLIGLGGGGAHERDAFRQEATRHVVSSRSQRETAIFGLPGRENDVRVFPPFADPEDHLDADRRRAAARRRWGLGPDVPVFGYVARLDRSKRIEDFIRAAAQVRVAFPSARFKVFGGPDTAAPEYADEMRKLVINHHMTESIEFMGEQDDIPTVLAGLDALCWLSERDSLPQIVVEAGEAGLAVIATAPGESPAARGAISECVEDGVTGLLVPRQDPTAVAGAMIRLLSDADWRRGLGAGLRRRVENGYSADAIVPRWLSLFQEVAAERAPAPRSRLFRSFIQGGFECSSHRRRDGRRLDLIAGTGHDIRATEDYRTLAGDGLLTVRDGVRWHLIEPEPGRRDWSSFLTMLRAARDSGTQVIWDLLHYGWPDDIDIWSPQFCERFRDFSRDLALLVQSETDAAPFYCPVNEISFFSWGGGDVGYLNPFDHNRGRELKAQLARASIMAMEAIREVEPRARFVHAEPVIHVTHHPGWPQERATANAFRMAQFEAWDMLAGRVSPELGGRPGLLDVMGLNYYSNNQWCHLGPTVHADNPDYKPFRAILAETYARYGRPLFISETGREGDLRPEWFAMVCREVHAARAMGVPVEGICLYPVLDHPGWDDDRDCANGLYRQSAVPGVREPFRPLLEEVRRWRAIFGDAHGPSASPQIRRPSPVARPAGVIASGRALISSMLSRLDDTTRGR